MIIMHEIMISLQAVIVLKGACACSTQSCIYAEAACVDALRHRVARVWLIPLIRSHCNNLFGTNVGAFSCKFCLFDTLKSGLTQRRIDTSGPGVRLWREGGVAMREGGLARWGHFRAVTQMIAYFLNIYYSFSVSSRPKSA